MYSPAWFDNCEMVHVENCYFENAGYAGLTFSKSARDITIINNTFNGAQNSAVRMNGDYGGSSWDGVFCENILLEGNTVRNIGASALSAAGAFDINLTDKVTIKNNYFYNCGETVNGSHFGASILVKQSRNILIDNNTVVIDGIATRDGIRTGPLYTRDCLFVKGYDPNKHLSDSVTITNNEVIVKNNGRIVDRGIMNRFGGQDIKIDGNTISVDKTSFVKRAYFVAGNNITLTNNILINSGDVRTFIYQEVVGDWYGLGKATNVKTLNNNIINNN